MKEIGLWGGQGTNPPPGPKKSGVVAYCLVSVPHRGQVLTSPLLLRVICALQLMSACAQLRTKPSTHLCARGHASGCCGA